MSEIYVSVIFGCPVPDLFSAVETDTEAVSQLMVEAAHARRDYRSEVGFHQTYDPARDYYWFGVEVNCWPSGFAPIPKPPGEDVTRSVWEAWRALPADTRRLLGEPTLFLLIAESDD